jgi:uncharacterized protein
MFAGTSTGAILALAFANGVSPADLVQYFILQAPKIFNRDLIRDIFDGAGLLEARYPTAPLRESLFSVLGAKTLLDFDQKVLLSTFLLDGMQDTQDSQQRNWKAKFFHNFDSPNNGAEQFATDVAVRSCSAPTYFPIYQGYVDGGIVANNPSMCAIAQAINPTIAAVSLEDIVLLSFGTGVTQEFVSSRDGDWGLAQWGFKILHMLMQGSVGLADYQCTQLLGARYMRVNVNLPEAMDLDASNKIPQMLALADGVDLQPIIAWIDAFWKREA